MPTNHATFFNMAAINQLITEKGQKNYIEESTRIPHFYIDKKVDTITPKEFLDKV